MEDGRAGHVAHMVESKMYIANIFTLKEKTIWETYAQMGG
jgi:hypothetical protein